MCGAHRDRQLQRRLGLLGVGLLMALYPFHVYVSSIVSFNGSYGDLLIGTVGLLWLLGAVGIRRLPRFSYPVAAFVLIAAVSIAAALATGASYLVPRHSGVEFLKLLGAIAWFVGTFVLCTHDTVRRTQVMALVSVLFATAFAIQTAHEGLVLGVLRPEGPFQNPNIYANYLVLNGFLAAYLVGTLQPERRLLGGLLSLTLPVLAVGLVVTASRGSLIGAVAGFCAVPILHPRTNLRSLVQPVLLIPVALTVSAGYWVVQRDAWIRGRLWSSVEPDGQNVGTRLRRWSHGVDGFLENPVLGVGFGQSQNYVSDAGFGGAYPRLHNTHLTIVSETGVIGALAFYLLFGMVVVQSVRLAREHEPAYAFLGAFIVAIMAEAAVTDVHTFRSLWIVTGMIAALSYHHFGEVLDVRDIPDDVDEAVESLSGSIERIGTS